MASSNSSAGFALVNSTNNGIQNCKALDNGATGNAYGFVSSGGVANSFMQCVAQGTVSTVSTGTVAGFGLLNGEAYSKIIDCKSCETLALTCSGSPYGILLDDSSILSQVTGSPFAVGAVPTSVAWSPSGSYLAVANLIDKQCDHLRWFDICPDCRLTICCRKISLGQSPGHRMVAIWRWRIRMTTR